MLSISNAVNSDSSDCSPAAKMEAQKSLASLRRSKSSRDMLFNLHAAGAKWAEADVAGQAEQQEVDEQVAAHQQLRRSAEAALLEEVLHLGAQCRPPRVLMVSRRHCRKQKYVDIVGEYHLDLLQEFGAAPIVIPRTTKTVFHLAEYLPMDGLLIVEGNDLSDNILQKYGCSVPGRLEGESAQKFASDTEFDVSKDELEFALMRLALTEGCPILSICRGCQLLNALRGGTLIGDIESEVQGDVIHLRDSSDPTYDSFRHPISVVPGTPLAEWFAESLKGDDKLLVNSYHHQGVKELGRNLREMARAPDGVLEAFYDADYDPKAGRFMIGLQFHPERMLTDYPGCSQVYRAFGEACHAYKARQEAAH